MSVAVLSLPSMLESVMLLCFGFSWPVSIAKTLRVKSVSGKSIWFLVLIVVGYLSGVLMKVALAVENHQPIDKVAYLYALNGAMVIVDMLLYAKYRVKPGAQPQQ